MSDLNGNGHAKLAEVLALLSLEDDDHQEVQLPALVVFRGKVYRIAATRRRRLVLTRVPPSQKVLTRRGVAAILSH